MGREITIDRALPVFLGNIGSGFPLYSHIVCVCVCLCTHMCTLMHTCLHVCERQTGKKDHLVLQPRLGNLSRFFNPYPTMCVLILEREEGKEREIEASMGERNINQQPPNICPDWGSNLQPFGKWDSTPMNQPPGQGFLFLFVVKSL